MNKYNNCSNCLNICSCCRATKCSECRPFGDKFDIIVRRCIPKPRFDIGDHVRVKNNLIVGCKYKMDNEQAEECMFSFPMSTLLGKYVTIINYLPQVNRYIVSFNGVNTGWLWVDEMFEDGVWLPF